MAFPRLLLGIQNLLLEYQMALKKPKAAAVKKAPRAKLATPFAPLKFNDFTITQKRRHDKKYKAPALGNSII